MKKKILLSVISLLFVCLVMLAGCGILDSALPNVSTGTSIKVEKIEIDETVIILATSGIYSEKLLEPKVLPDNATNKKVTYSVVDSKASTYFSVSSNGLLRSNGIEIPEEEYFDVKITSVQNTKVSITIRVTVMKAEPKRLSFSADYLAIQLGTNGVKAEPKITPFFAVVDGDINYEITDKPYDVVVDSSTTITVTPAATVDRYTGIVKGVRQGTATLRAYLDMGSKVLDATIEVKVDYAPLNYQINVRTQSLSIYKQIEGATEGFFVDVTKEASDPCDPNPEIYWYLNGSAIKDSLNINGSFSVYIDPATLGMNRGTHILHARLESGSLPVQILEIDPIHVHAPLKTFNVQKIGGDAEHKIDDVVSFTAHHGTVDDEYPPDGYAWYYINGNNPTTEVKIAETSPDNDGVGRFSYEIKSYGTFDIVCYPIIKNSIVTEFRRVISLGTISSSITIKGEDITGVYVDGGVFEGQNHAYIKWDALPYNADFKVYIKGSNGKNRELDSKAPSDKKYFTDYGVYVPREIATLEESFTYRIKSYEYDYGKDYSYSGGSINENGYSFLNIVHLNFNSYIVNVEEMGELLNYVSLFRPSDYYATDATGNNFELKLYIPFTYDEIKNIYGYYPPQTPGDNKTPAQRNILNILNVAFYSYCDTSSFGADVRMGIGGEAIITLYFDDLIGVDDNYLETNSNNDKIDYSFEPHYAQNLPQYSSIGLRDDKLPIDAQKRKMSVYTSNQLYYAASIGYEPIPEKDSPAEAVYKKARLTLRRIIRDNMTDAEKIHAIYDFLTCELVYDYELAELTSPDIHKYKGFYLEGVFDGKAVCDGIAKAFNLLCIMEGIATKKIGGFAVDYNGDQVGHAWNMVFDNNKWYLVDATWGNKLVDSTFEISTHLYLMGPASLYDDHLSHGKYPTASTTANDVFYTTVVAGGNTTLQIKSENDIVKLINNLVNVRLEDSDFVWFEVYVTPQFSTNSSVIEQAFLQSLSNNLSDNIIGFSLSHINVGNGYHIFRVNI